MIGIISAIDFELKKLIDISNIIEIKTICEIDFYHSIIEDKHVVMAVCGEGKVNSARCAQIMICEYNVESIINIGVAGSLNPGLHLGDFAIASSVVQHDFDLSPTGIPLGSIPYGKRSSEYPCGDKTCIEINCSDSLTEIIENVLRSLGLNYLKGVIATGDQFVASSELKDKIINNFNALACEMEGAAIGQVCRAAEIDFAVLRSISDNADEDASDSYFNNQDKYGIEDIMKKVLNLI